jgi:serine/threonine-protein kinase ATR
MVLSANNSALSRWKDFFYSCRTAVRTPAGLKIAEFILPLLVLDRICFGTTQDEELIRQEFSEVLTFDPKLAVPMDDTDRQKAVNALFTVIDTLSYWAERETENRHKSSRNSGKSSSKGRRNLSTRGKGDTTSSASWPADETISRIEDVLSKISLKLQASAAANVGMKARALRLLEMAARKHAVEQVFESSGDSQKETIERFGSRSWANPTSQTVNLDLMKNVLVALDDCETMTSIGDDSVLTNPSLQVRDSIRQKEAAGDFEGALQDYERLLQVERATNRDPKLERGALHCLLELGQFESVLNQVAGLTSREATKEAANPANTTSFAVEAAWRLGRWQTLSDLVETDLVAYKSSGEFSCYDTYQMCTGKAMLGLQRKEASTITSAIQSARETLMQRLSGVARESYSRSYSEIVRLQCLREIENANDVLCVEADAGSLTLDEVAHSTSHEGWAWDGRLDLSTSHGASSVISTRVALARLSGDPVLEGSLFLSIGKRARKNLLHTIAENFFSQAEAAFTSISPNEFSTNSKLGNLLDSIRVQVAKLKHEKGESAVALKMLGQEGVQRTFDQMLLDVENSESIMKLAVKYERQRIARMSGLVASVGDNDKTLSHRFASRLLRLTQWTVEGGLKGGSEIVGRFRVIHKLAPEWEKGAYGC